MKKSDLGIVMIHWMLAVFLLGASISGLCLWAKRLQPYLSFIFESANVGAIHIGLSMVVAFILLGYFAYQKHKNCLDRLALHRPLFANWRRMNILILWILFVVVFLETISGILLTKLIDKDVLSKVFGIERAPLAYFHLALVTLVLLFPVAHVTIHWLDGRSRKILSIFRPHVYPRKPSMATIMAKLREENTRLRKEKVDYDSNR